MSAVVAAGTSTAAGRTRVTTRALTRVVTAVTADALDVDPEHVHVDLDDHEGRLGVTVRTPIGIPSLAELDDRGPDRSLLARSGEVRQALKDRVPAMTGYTVSRVTVHLTGVRVVRERRVA